MTGLVELGRFVEIVERITSIIGSVAIIVGGLAGYQRWRTRKLEANIWLGGAWMRNAKPGDMYVQLFNNAGASFGIDSVQVQMKRNRFWFASAVYASVALDALPTTIENNHSASGRYTAMAVAQSVFKDLAEPNTQRPVYVRAVINLGSRRKVKSSWARLPTNPAYSGSNVEPDW